MKNKIKHSWKAIDGFRTHLCIHCGIIRYWDNGFEKLIYKITGKIWYYEMPVCKRIFNNDHIEKPEKELIKLYKETVFN